MMAKRQAKRVRRELTPDEKRRWEKATAETVAERDEIVKQGGAALGGSSRRAADAQRIEGGTRASRPEPRRHDAANGMSRGSISRLENDPKPNPTMLTFARYAAALGLELRFSVKKEA